MKFPQNLLPFVLWRCDNFFLRANATACSKNKKLCQLHGILSLSLDFNCELFRGEQGFSLLSFHKGENYPCNLQSFWLVNMSSIYRRHKLATLLASSKRILGVTSYPFPNTDNLSIGQGLDFVKYNLW